MTVVAPDDAASRRFAWRKSSRSQTSNCVEVGLPTVEPGLVVAVRDSKDPHGAALTFPRESWAAFLADVRRGAFDNDR